MIHRMAFEGRRLNPTLDVLAVLNYQGPGVKEVSIGGSFALSTILQKQWPAQDIDIFIQVDVPEALMNRVENTTPIVECMCDTLGWHYDFQFQHVDCTGESKRLYRDSSKDIVRAYMPAGVASLDYVVVEYKIRSPTDFALISILCSTVSIAELGRGFDLECCASYVTKNQVSIPRPEFTFAGYTLYVENRSYYSSNRVQKYKNRGFKVFHKDIFDKQREYIRNKLGFTKENSGLFYYMPELSQLNPNYAIFASWFGPYENLLITHSSFSDHFQL